MTFTDLVAHFFNLLLYFVHLDVTGSSLLHKLLDVITCVLKNSGITEFGRFSIDRTLYEIVQIQHIR